MLVTMSEKEPNRLAVSQAVVEECLRCRDAAAPLGLTECQVQRLNDSRDSQGLSTSTLALLSSPLMICKVLSRPIS